MTDPPAPRTVGVIFSLADLRRAVRLRRPPDFFELRLDALVRSLDELDTAKFPAPLILTARDPREGGMHKLAVSTRYDLLLRFLPRAQGIDIELRSATAFRSILDLACAKKIQRIISFHDLRNTPLASRLHEKASAAQEFGANIFKVATRTDTHAQVNRLVEFFESAEMPVAAMGIGRLGRAVRHELFRRGSSLNYGHLGGPGIDGQPSLLEMRRWRAS